LANGETDFSKVHSLADQRHAAMTSQTPRETLLEILGKIDRGELDPDVMVITYGYWDEKDERCNGFTAAGPDALAAYGVLAAALMMLTRG
jgi:hypothetical protein